MREASVTTAAPAWLLLLLIVVPAVAVAAPDDGPRWSVLLKDDALDATTAAPGAIPTVDPRVDILEVAVGEEPDWLSIRMTTRASSGAPSVPTRPQGAPEGDVETVVDVVVVRAADGMRHALRITALGMEAVIARDGSEFLRLPLAQDHTSWGYTLKIQRWDLLPEGPLEIGDILSEPWASARTTNGFGDSIDRAPSTGFGDSYKIQTASRQTALLPPWAETEGVDFAAGPSITVGPDGKAHLAYLVYRADRGTAKGLYHASFDATEASVGAPPGWKAQRVADAVMLTELHEDGNTQTAIALTSGGAVQIVYYPRPNAGGGIRFAMSAPAGWKIEDPSVLSDGRRLPVDDNYRAIPAIVTTSTRTVVAFQSGSAVAIVERGASGSWNLIERLDDARFPRLAAGPEGKLHVAWLGGAPRTDDVDVGSLRYAKESSGWRATEIATGIGDYSGFWETAETDGSFAFALDKSGTPHFVWESQRGGPMFGTLRPSGVVSERAPLTPSHGNPQVRMRMVVDGDGRAHILSGYGGTDTYAIRDARGLWMREETPRGDMAQLALTPDGRAITSYTQPHGGTTLAMRAQTVKAGAPEDANNAELGTSSASLGNGPFPPLARALLTAIAGGSVGAVLAVLLNRRFLLVGRYFAIIGAFSRIARPEAAEHETRAKILTLATAEPGLAPHEMRKRLGIARSTFFYHLHRLERERFITLPRRGARVVVAPVAWSPDPETVLAPSLRELLAAVRELPGSTVIDYAARVNQPRRTVAHQLKQLEEEGFVQKASGSLRPQRWEVR